MIAYLKTLCKTDEDCEDAEVKLCAPQPIWSPKSSGDPLLYPYSSGVNSCEPYCPGNYLKVCCTNPECDPCYDFSTYDLSHLCQDTKEPCCNRCVYCNRCCPHMPPIDPWSSHMPPNFADVNYPPSSYRLPVPRADRLYRSRSNLSSPAVSLPLAEYPKGRPIWDPCYVATGRSGFSYCGPPSREIFPLPPSRPLRRASR
ncbi:hypothetical protein RRG08_026316 [Elysia crispata]|uniref:Uncharacterized protein n=1 Tax=Elysia crispata TaxID=231223 RepID=A0AAE0ZAM3_9GAST|nr:hypothetical protein RRG08_026316 [Elysia crispata]